MTIRIRCPSKSCICCRERKPTAEFYEHPMMADGRLNKCRDCCKLHAAANYRAKREAHNQRYGFPQSATKQCKDCGQVKPLDEFYYKATGKYQRRAECTTCFAIRHAADAPKTQEARIRWRRNNPGKTQAQATLRRAVRSCRIAKPSTCSRCGREASRIEGHHNDYTKPLKVEWLCTKCHGAEHRKKYNKEVEVCEQAA